MYDNGKIVCGLNRFTFQMYAMTIFPTCTSFKRTDNFFRGQPPVYMYNKLSAFSDKPTYLVYYGFIFTMILTKLNKLSHNLSFHDELCPPEIIIKLTSTSTYDLVHLMYTDVRTYGLIK